MRLLLAILLLGLFAESGFAAPIDYREIRLLIQGGTREAEIIADVNKRKLAKPLNSEETETLRAAGAGTKLLALIASPEIVLTDSEASRYFEEKQRSAENAKLLALPRVWLLGQITQVGESGDAFVVCDRLSRAQTPNGQPKPDEIVHFSQKPPSFRLEEKGPSFVNCMAAIVGLHEHAVNGGGMKTIQEVVIIESLLPAARPYGDLKSGPVKRAAVTRRATLPSGEWLPLANYGGPNVQMKILNIQMSFLKIQIERTGPVQEIRIDPGGRTLIHDDGHGCRTFHVYDINCPSGSGVFEFDHTPESVSYPKGA